MSIQNSINFISDVNSDNDFRAFLNDLNPNEIPACIKAHGYDFTQHEFEESINLLHVKCQFEEQANRLFEIVNWYKIITSPN